ncbi:YozE family protein [Streptomyces erythrochromogenes]|uniref:YozE family protein n=1 Tax=Streptomyces erythrochromogenes TaxID=285574 RepID=UPI0038083463
MGEFTAWLLRHVTDQDGVGELARLAAADPDWPEGPDRLQTFTDYLEGSGVTRATLQSLTDAWVRYASEQPSAGRVVIRPWAGSCPGARPVGCVTSPGSGGAAIRVV